MALTKSITHLKATYANAYAKVTLASVQETGLDETGKIYSITAQVNVYADNVKDTDLYQVSITKDGYRESELTLANAYLAVKADSQFSDRTDC